MDQLSKTTKWVIGGAIGSAALGIAALILADDGKASVAGTSGRSLRKDEVISILKDLRRECMAAFITLATFSQSIKEQTGGKIRDSDLKEILTNQSPLLDQIRKSERKVYEKYEITEKALKQGCKRYASD